MIIASLVGRTGEDCSHEGLEYAEFENVKMKVMISAELKNDDVIVLTALEGVNSYENSNSTTCLYDSLSDVMKQDQRVRKAVGL